MSTDANQPAPLRGFRNLAWRRTPERWAATAARRTAEERQRIHQLLLQPPEASRAKEPWQEPVGRADPNSDGAC
jgi:hypothetical protein